MGPTRFAPGGHGGHVHRVFMPEECFERPLLVHLILVFEDIDHIVLLGLRPAFVKLMEFLFVTD